MKLLPFEISKIKKISAVYLLFDKEMELIYVGVSKDIRTRLQQHTSINARREVNGIDSRYTTKIPYNTVKFYAYIEETDEEKRKFIEQGLVYFFNPKYNSTYGLK